MFAKAENQTAWKTISLRLPVTNDSAVFTVDEGIYWNKFGRSTLTIDAKTLEVSKWESYGEQNSAQTTSFVGAVYAHRRNIRFFGTIHRLSRLHRRRVSGLDGNFSGVKTFSKLAK